jgi:flagellar hook-associated protein 2
MDSTTSSIVKTLGAGSGVDMAALASGLAAAQFQARLDRLATRSETLDRQISTASSLRNAISTLASSLGDRVRQGDLSPQPQVANASVAQATSTFGANSAASYTLEVLSLAASQTLKSPAIASATAPVGAGTLTLRFGTVSGASFTEDTGHAAVPISIASGSSLGDIASATNAADSGVIAYVANGTGGARLVLKGAEGAASGFILEASETPGEEGLAALAWEPAAGDPARLVAAAADAAFRLDGVDMTSTSNSAGAVAPGLSLTLTGTNPGSPTRITFSNPASNIGLAMQDLTSALNEIAGQLREATNPQGGDLARDSGARALQRALSGLAGAVIMPGATGDEPRTLADLGLATERDGTFRLDGTRLTATLERDPAGAAAMFTTGLYGIYATIDRINRSTAATSDPGSLAGSITRYGKLKTETSADTAELSAKQEDFRARLASRFAVVDSRVAASQSTLSFLKAQIDAWNAGNN